MVLMIFWLVLVYYKGRHLGLLLFILFMNDLPTILDGSVNIYLCADDGKIFSVITSPNDALKLQSNLD